MAAKEFDDIVLGDVGGRSVPRTVDSGVSEVAWVGSDGVFPHFLLDVARNIDCVPDDPRVDHRDVLHEGFALQQREVHVSDGLRVAFPHLVDCHARGRERVPVRRRRAGGKRGALGGLKRQPVCVVLGRGDRRVIRQLGRVPLLHRIDEQFVTAPLLRLPLGTQR